MVWGYDRLAPLKAYYEEFGTLISINRKDIYTYQGQDIRIGELIASLRVAYNRGELSSAKISELECLGMVWGYDRLAPLKAYYEEFGTIANISQRDSYIYQDKCINIGFIIMDLRKKYRNNKLFI